MHVGGPGFLQSLKYLGFPNELRDLEAAAVAARARVALHEDWQSGGIQVDARARRLVCVLEVTLGPEEHCGEARRPMWLHTHIHTTHLSNC